MSGAAVAAAKASALYGNPIAGIATYASVVAQVLANMAAAKKILAKAGDSSTVPDLGGGGTDASGGIPLNPQPQASTLLNPDGTPVNPNKEQPIVKAYVVETEMTSSQQKIQSIENRSKY
jgi:hypothetical protein